MAGCKQLHFIKPCMRDWTRGESIVLLLVCMVSIICFLWVGVRMSGSLLSKSKNEEPPQTAFAILHHGMT